MNATAPPVPDLSADLPPEPSAPDRDLVSSWSYLSMGGYLAAEYRLAAWGHAKRAAEIQAGRAGIPQWLSSREAGVLSALAGAEVAAARVVRELADGARHVRQYGTEQLAARADEQVAEAEKELAWHAARLDAFAAAYGLKGWYRTTGLRGEHCIQINKIRTREDGDRGRYYVHRTGNWDFRDRPFWVVDRDTGRTACMHGSGEAAANWVRAAEEHWRPTVGGVVTP